MPGRGTGGTIKRWPQHKKTREPTLTIDSLLGGGYLRLPASLTVGVVTLRALCQEREQAEPLRYDRQPSTPRTPRAPRARMRHKKKRGSRCVNSDSLLGGGYLLSHFRSTIGVVRLNFSVRNGKRWDPHAMTTLSLPFQPGRRIGLRRGCDDLKRPSGERGMPKKRRFEPGTDIGRA